jgi:ATP-dependent RNA helicase DeaD
MKFTDLPIKDTILSALEKIGFETPSPIQEQTIPRLIEEKSDCIALAQTGTGKTAAFGIPLLHNIEIEKKVIQGLIVCPTRELCLQISNEMSKYAQNMPVSIVPVYGGTPMGTQTRQLKKNPQIVVCTPGRLIDHLQRKNISLSDVKVVILDEADEMLNMGFQEDIDKILAYTPKEKNVWLFSATMARHIATIAEQYMNNPFNVTIGHKNESAKNIEHQYCVTQPRNQYSALKRLIDSAPEIFGIVFCQTKRETKEIAYKLSSDGYNADALHGELSQKQRDDVMKKFRNRVIQILVATDVAARGLDVNDVTHVMHIGLPNDASGYTHRSGRTARAGKSGLSIAVISNGDTYKIKQIQRRIQKDFTLIRIPQEKDVYEQRLQHFITNVIENEEIKIYNISPEIQQVIAQAIEQGDAQTIITRCMINTVGIPAPKDSQHDLNIDPRQSRERSSRDDRRGDSRDRSSGRRSSRSVDRRDRSSSSSSRGDNNRLRINIGEKDGISESSFENFISTITGPINGNSIKHINIERTCTFFSLKDRTSAEQLMSARNAQFKNRRVRIESAFKGR